MRRAWRFHNELWLNRYMATWEEPTHWNDLKQGSARADREMFENIIHEFNCFDCTNVDQYENYCICTTGAVCPKTTPEMLCDHYGHPHRLTLENYTRDEIANLTHRNAPENIKYPIAAIFHDVTAKLKYGAISRKTWL